MNKTKYILLVVAAILAACKNGLEPTFSVGADDNAIVLAAGISDGGGGVVTRAGSEGAHVPFSNTTQMRLYVEGTWTGKTTPTITQYTNCTTSDPISELDNVSGAKNDIHPLGSFTPQLYWDDYGTADPDNATNRANGLAVFGVAVDGLGTLPSELSGITGDSWTSLLWSVKTDGANVLQKDLVVSNNHGDNSAPTTSGIKFTERTVPSKNILEYQHMMSKVTFVLTASNGFTDNKFTNTPDVVLTRNEYNQTTEDEYCYTSGTVNIKEASATGSTLGTVTLQHKETTDAGVVTKYALIYPGSNFGNNDADIIARINADGNIYYVTAKEIRTKMHSLNSSTDYKTESGKNYVLNITVNKTGIDVEATIKDWVDVTAANEAPVINISDAYGHDGTGFNRNFDLYRSTAVNGSYLTGITEGNHTVVNYVPEAGSDPVVPAHYELVTQMYWPNHSTHYFFRGIWPLVDSKDGSSLQLGPTSSQVKANSIEVANVAYKQGYYPSDLMIGIPRKNDGSYDETCKVAGHDKSAGANGICATEGKIRMNFQYAMSQVLVELKTSTGADKVIFDAETKVEIIGGYTQGEIKLSDESSDFTGKTVTDYFMHNIANDDYDSYRDAIIPQSLVDGSGNATLKFRITVKSGETYDKYETVLGIKDIQVQENGGEKKSITAWKPGKKYTYTLQITKSGVKVEATLKDWITVTADEPIWF